MTEKLKFASLFLLLGLMIVNCSKKQKDDQQIPMWAKEAVWYQIFPERFRNDDPSNDPKIEDIIGAYPFDDHNPIQTPPWTSDWYQLLPQEQDGKGFYYHAQRRRYGGDLLGALDKLNYLQELGINAIYFNPVFESPSLHKYDGASFHHIDDNFGPNPAVDKQIVATEIPDDPDTWKWTTADSLFLKLIKECHEREIKIIIDGVFNHVGLNFFAFLDVKQKQQQSKYKDWFIVTSWDDPNTDADEFEYQCWNNVKSLPEIREDRNGFDRDAWVYMKASIKRWMDPNGDGDPADGIDGWRLDVAEKVTEASWKKFRKYVRSINPQAYISGEIWWERWPEKMFNAAPWLQGNMFDAVMNYRFAASCTKFFIDKKNRTRASQFDKELEQIRLDYPADVNYALQNLLDSHDTDRLASMIVNPDRPYGSGNRLENNRDYNIRKPNEDEIKIHKLMVLFQMTYIGAPMIYYGDEAGMWGASDPDDRKPMLWDDLKFDDEVNHPFGEQRTPDSNKFNQDLFNYYKTLIKIRREHPALSSGDFQTLFTDDQRSVIVFERKFPHDYIVVALNNSDFIQTFKLPLDGKYWMDVLTGNSYFGIDGKLGLTLESKSGLILVPGMETRLAMQPGSSPAQ